jgi:hypothetical protein
MNFLSTLPLFVVFLASIAILFMAAETGYLLGARHNREANVATLEASILGLLALMLGFSFSMAMARFEERREAVLNEANAIGTAALRASLLPAPHDAQSLTLFRDYTAIRIEIAKAPPSPAQLDAAIARSNSLQMALWR